MKKMSQNLIKMRNRNLIIVALLLLCTQTLCSQKIDQHLDMDNMSFFKEATMVVEGRFLNNIHTYTVKDIQGKEHYYGIWKVIAHKVFKGDAKAGDTIYVVREGTSLKEAKFWIYDLFYNYDEATGEYKLDNGWDIYYDIPPIARSRNIYVDVENAEFRQTCVMFFKKSTFPKTNEKSYASLPQYQYLYPWVYYEEGTKLYVSGDKFAGLNDTLFNSRNDLYRFMLEAGGYDTSVVKISEQKTQDKNRDYINRTLPPEVEQRWGGQKKNTPDQR